MKKNSERAIQEWMLDDEDDGFKLAKSYEEWKKMVLKRFKKPEPSLTEHFAQKQQKDESIVEFIARMKRVGKTLKMKCEIRLQVIKGGVTVDRSNILLSLAGKKEISETLIEELAEKESITREARKVVDYNVKKQLTTILICCKCGKPGHIRANCLSGRNSRLAEKSRTYVNNIKKLGKFINKSDSIYINCRL